MAPDLLSADDLVTALHHRVLDRLSRGAESSLVVGFAGAAGLGKTSVAASLVSRLGLDRAIHVRLDGFLHDRATRRSKGVNGYQLAGWRVSEARRGLTPLMVQHTPAQVPIYTPQGQIKPGRTVSPASVLLLDGNLPLLDAQLRALLSELVYFDATLEIMQALRRRRDIREGRFTAAEADDVWFSELPSLEQNIVPGRQLASCVVTVHDCNLFWYAA